jgi:trehalose 6-phosphate phosphatase
MRRVFPPPGRPDVFGSIQFEEAALFFDVDGTLIELRPSPGDVEADGDLIGLLRRLRARTDNAVALVSGRALSDLDRIFSPLTLPAAALHGAEVRYPDGELQAADPRVMDHARPAAMRFVSLHPELLLEDKGATLAIHFRRKPELGPAVLQFMNGFAPSDDVAVQEGKLVCELKPALFDKGGAIRSLMRRPPFLGRIPCFFGDDLTDETGFATVNALGGLSVRVGAPETPTEASAHLLDAQALRTCLADRLDARGRS